MLTGYAFFFSCGEKALKNSPPSQLDQATSSLPSSLTATSVRATMSGPGRGDWWMFGREPTHNRRSNYRGIAEWTIWFGYKTDGQVKSSPAVGADGTIYVGSTDGYLYAKNGQPPVGLKWKYPAGGQILSSPAIGEDGTIYFTNYVEPGSRWEIPYLYALNDEGQDSVSIKWGLALYSGENFSSPAVGPDKSIYFGSANQLWAVVDDGWPTFKWPVLYLPGQVYSSPAIAIENTYSYIYVGINISNNSGAMVKVDARTGSVVWIYETPEPVMSSPAIASDGTIYFGTARTRDPYAGRFYALNPDATLKWVYQPDGSPNGSPILSSPAIDYYGDVYFGCDNGRIYEVSAGGGAPWSYLTGGAVRSSPAVSGIVFPCIYYIYIGSYDDNIYAVHRWGSLAFYFPTQDVVESSPAIGLFQGEVGWVVCGSNDGWLYLITPLPGV